MPSRQDRRNVKVGSTSFLISIGASRTMAPQASRATTGRQGGEGRMAHTCLPRRQPPRLVLAISRQTIYDPPGSPPTKQALMTQLFDTAVRAARNLPPEVQDDIARIVLRLAVDAEAAPIALTADERAAIENSLEQAARGDFATEAEVDAAWAKLGL